MKIKYIIFSILLIVLGSSSSYAKTFSYSQVHKMPMSIEKDYYIWRFLSQRSTSKKEAQKIIYEASRLNKKLRVAYRAKTGKSITLPKREPKRQAKGAYQLRLENNWRSRVNAHKNFQKGLSLLQKNQKSQAIRYFEKSRQGYIKPYDVDKSLFWLYLTTKNRKYLKLLRQSLHINIYTLMAADTLKRRYPKTITNSIYKSKTRGFDIEDPIDWAKVKREMNSGCNLDNLADKHRSQECIGVYTYLKARASDYTKSYFPMPYRKAMRRMSKQRQALIYAIARQESRFVPASVSRSFALGMMQFMPFLIEHIAKEKGQRIDLDDMFNPYKAIEYADYHLDYLTKYLHHPLFIAYAYNGGIGFTKRHIIKKSNFRNGPYEPYMSMETMENDEAREYGKKVLANYVIYLNKLGVKTRIFPLLKTLTTPSKTDKFR